MFSKYSRRLFKVNIQFKVNVIMLVLSPCSASPLLPCTVLVPCTDRETIYTHHCLLFTFNNDAPATIGK